MGQKYCGASWVGQKTLIMNNRCSSFRDGAKITVHLDMNERTCDFTVNGKKYREILKWNNLPAKLYPVVSLQYPGRFRIRSHQKNWLQIVKNKIYPYILN